MNNNAEALLKLLVPAIFFLIWAINQVVNRETPTPPQRNGNPLGPRPGGLPPAPRPVERSRPQPSSYRDVTYEQAPSYPARTATSTKTDQDFLIIRDDGRAVPASPAGRSSAPPEGRRQPKTRGNRPGGSEPGSQRARRQGNGPQANRESSAVSRAPIARPAITPQDSSAPSSTEPAQPPRSDLSPLAARLRQSLSSPDRIREAWLLNELLGPPVSQRRPSAAPRQPPR